MDLCKTTFCHTRLDRRFLISACKSFSYIVFWLWSIGLKIRRISAGAGARGIVIAMNGYTSGVVESVAKGKELKVLLLDGMHLSNVIYGRYTFTELLDHAVKYASLQGQLYCPHALA